MQSLKLFEFLNVSQVSKASKDFIERHCHNFERSVINKCEILTDVSRHILYVVQSSNYYVVSPGFLLLFFQVLNLYCEARDCTIWKICINAAVRTRNIEVSEKVEDDKVRK